MERSCDEANMTKEDRICLAFLKANAAQAGNLEEMQRRNYSPMRNLCSQTSDDSVIIIEEPLETIDICSISSFETVEVIDREIMTKTPDIQSSDPFKLSLSNAWCSKNSSALCDDAYELFKMAYCRRHPHLQRNVDAITTNLWRHMTAAQRMPFHAEAFVSQIIILNVPFNETVIRDYFENVNGVVNK